MIFFFAAIKFSTYVLVSIEKKLFGTKYVVNISIGIWYDVMYIDFLSFGSNSPF